MILVPDRSWNHCISCSLGKWVRYFGAELPIPLGNVMDHLKSSVVEGLNGVLKQSSLTPLLFKA